MNSEEKRQLLRRVRGFVLDMDGTIYLGNELFPFTKAFLEAAGRTGRETFFFTNNSSKNAACYIEKLRGMGIETDAGRMFTSNQVAVRHLAARSRRPRLHPGHPLSAGGFPGRGLHGGERRPRRGGAGLRHHPAI